ncbi:cysteine hydrolase family protein [Pseudophaeobacter arcticus]|uniref:cysteine hydrolase family protein n=1 Tax=Pseudophaeobacter arcticus TaxID=385492 RepID=UPI0024920887|nr:cysteine hydrolase family protein [Pseudophaeobacter arcticus]
MSKTALLLVDIQNDYFPGGDWELHAMEQAAENAASLLAAAREAGQMVVHIRHENPSAEAPFFRPGSRGAEIHSAVAPTADEPVLTKARPNSFLNTGLSDLLQEAGIEALTLCGAMSQMCIDATARAGRDLGFDITLAEDACAARAMAFGGVELSAQQVHAAFMAPLAMSYARVVSTAELLKN